MAKKAKGNRVQVILECTEHKKRLYTWTSPDGQHQIRLIIFFASKDGEALYSQQKQDRELTVAQIMNSLLPNSDLIEASREKH